MSSIVERLVAGLVMIAVCAPLLMFTTVSKEAVFAVGAVSAATTYVLMGRRR